MAESHELQDLFQRFDRLPKNDQAFVRKYVGEAQKVLTAAIVVCEAFVAEEARAAEKRARATSRPAKVTRLSLVRGGSDQAHRSAHRAHSIVPGPLGDRQV